MKILIDKSLRTLRLLDGTRIERSYRVALGANPGRDKAIEGDGATPLGEFFICAKNPRSRFHLSLCISYPNAAHAARGLRAGLISAEEHAAILAALRAGRMPPQHTRLGGEIYIHGEAPTRLAADGGGGGGGGADWTHGCIALANEAVEELFARVDLGTPVEIRP